MRSASPPARHPEAYSLRVNRNVARSIGFTLPSEAELVSRMH